MKNISVFIDGTWSEPDDETNVYRLSQLARGEVLYFGGPGNQDDNGTLGQLFGGAFGLGSERIVRRVIDQLIDVYEYGDKVFVISYSRGAAIARIVCSRIPNIPIEFLGCWDTVASFGIPIDIGPFRFQRLNLFKGKDLNVSHNILRAVHLVAFHETRNAFKPTLMNHLPGIVEETWFPGAHEDIGSSQSALRYMAERAKESGLQVDVPLALPTKIHRPTGIVNAYKQGAREIHVLSDGKPDYSIKPWLHPSILDGFKIRGRDS